MNFGQAVNSALINKYSTFKGRACRAEWWYFLLFSFLLSVLVASVTVFFTFGSVDWEYVATLSEDNATSFILNSDFGTSLRVVSTVLALALFLPSFAVTVRRLQDLDLSYFWSIPYLFAALINIWITIAPTAVDSMVRLDALGNLIVIVYALTFLRKGNYDENRFGPSPLELEEDTY